MTADLHMHSTASDGEFSPETLVGLAHEAGASLIALTDHDSIDGVAQAKAAAQALGMRLIPGVEMGCGASKEIHILGYGIDTDNEAFRMFCAAWREKRLSRAREMVRRLNEAGMPITMERVSELARGVIARPHVARALVEAGFASSVADAFERYLVPGRCGYVPKAELKVAEAVRLIGEAGGVAVLAHPMELKMSEMNIEALVCEWKAQGLAGIEVYHPSTGNQHVPFLLSLARREGLLVTGGSDFHGEHVSDNRLRQGLERWTTMESDVQALLDAIGRQGRKRGEATCRA